MLLKKLQKLHDSICTHFCVAFWLKPLRRFHILPASLNFLQEGKVLPRWRMQDEFLHQSERRSQVAEVEQFDGRVRVAAWDIYLERGATSSRQVRRRRVRHGRGRQRH